MPEDYLQQQSRRAVYRIIYPIPERPTITLGEDVFPIVDCSELGLRFEVPRDHVPDVGVVVHGHVTFRRGAEVPVAGEVVRLQDGTVALWFRNLGIPFGDILAEQKYLRAEGYILGERT